MKTTNIPLDFETYRELRRLFENSPAYSGPVTVTFTEKTVSLVATLMAINGEYSLVIFSTEADDVSYDQAKALMNLLDAGMLRSYVHARMTKAGNHVYVVNNQFEYWALVEHVGYLGMHVVHSFPVLVKFGEDQSDQLLAIELGEFPDLFLG